MAFTRITDAELKGKGVIGQPDVPGLSSLEMQKSVEQVVREVAIPGTNRLIGELEAEGGAASLGSAVPAGDGVTELPAGTPHTLQGVLAAMMKLLAGFIARRDNPHKVTAAQTGAYTRTETEAAISKRVVEIGSSDMTKAVYDPKNSGIDVTIQAYAHTRSGTVNNFTGSGLNGRVKLTAAIQSGDTFAVNGQRVTAYMGTEDAAAAMAGKALAGKVLTFVISGSTMVFAGTGAATAAQGAKADAAMPRSGGTFTGSITAPGIVGDAISSLGTLKTLNGDLWLASTNNYRIGSNTASGYNLSKSPGGLRVQDSAGNLKEVMASNVAGASSLRYKHDVNDMEEKTALALLKMRPVTFEYNPERQDPGIKYGLIAEELYAVDSTCVYNDPDGQPEGINYTMLIPQLIKLAQMQQKEIDALRQANADSAPREEEVYPNAL